MFQVKYTLHVGALFCIQKVNNRTILLFFFVFYNFWNNWIIFPQGKMFPYTTVIGFVSPTNRQSCMWHCGEP